jgi:hypothetical protein
MRISLSILALPLLIWSAQIPTEVSHLPPAFEEYRKRIPTSGSAWVGFTVAESTARVDATEAFIRLPAGEGGVLCIDIKSRDGRYIGQFRFPLPQHRPTAVRLNIPTRFQRKLVTYSSRDLVVSAILTRSCPSSEGLHLPVSWTWPVVSDSVLISINSTLPVHVAWNSRGINHRVNCQQRTGGRSAGFNHSCLLSRASLGDSTQVVVRYGRIGSYNEIWKTVALP